MFEFFGNIFYFLLLGVILVITYITVRNAWSKEVVSGEPNALALNNFLIIFGIVLIIATFFIFSWLAGITTLVLSFIVYILASRKIIKGIERNIFNSAKRNNKK